MPDVPAPLRRRRLTAACAAAATAALLVGGLTGCDPEQPTPPPTTPPVSSPASTPSATPTPSPTTSESVDREEEEAAIKQAVLDYNEVLADISLDPKADIDQLKTVAAGELLEVSLGEYREWRAKGWRATKAVTVENLDVGKIAAKEGQRTAKASYCGNATGVDVVDRDGESQVGEDRQNFFPTIVDLIKNSDGTWMPVRQRTKGDACDSK